MFYHVHYVLIKIKEIRSCDIMTEYEYASRSKLIVFQGKIIMGTTVNLI